MAGSFAMSETVRPHPPQPTRPHEDASPPSSWARAMKQFGFFAAGAGFMAASVAVTRRSVVLRRLETIPKFYSSNRNKLIVDSSDRSLMAAEALGLATLNVMSFGVMLVGGIAWAFDLSSVEELRMRSQAAVQKSGIVNPEDEEQMEQMMNDLLARLGMDKPEKPEAPRDAEGSSKKD